LESERIRTTPRFYWVEREILISDIREEKIKKRKKQKKRKKK